MEKRRRARINSSLNELKSLILEAMKKDVSSVFSLFNFDFAQQIYTGTENNPNSHTSFYPTLKSFVFVLILYFNFSPELVLLKARESRYP